LIFGSCGAQKSAVLRRNLDVWLLVVFRHALKRNLKTSLIWVNLGFRGMAPS